MFDDIISYDSGVESMVFVGEDKYGKMVLNIFEKARQGG